MRNTPLIVGFILGAVAVGAIWALRPAAPSSTTTPGVDDGDRDAGVDEILATLRRIEARQEHTPGEGSPLTGVTPHTRAPVLGSTAEAGDAVVGAASSGTPSAVAAAAGGEDEAMLERLLDRWEAKKEERKFGRLDNKALLSEARRLRKHAKDRVAARAALETLLGRDLEDEERVAALTDLGGIHREMSEFDKSASALRDARRIAGADSVTGAQAGYQLVWTLAQAKQPKEALREADGLLRSSGLSDTLRPWARWAAAKMADQSGNATRALADWEQLLSDVSGNDAYRSITQEAALRITELGG